MRPSEKDKRLDEAISRTSPKPGPVPDFGQWQQAHSEAIKVLKAGAEQQPRSAGLIALFQNRIARVAAALLLTLGLGFAAGRFSSASQLERLQAELAVSLKATMNQQLQSALNQQSVQIREEIAQQLRHDLARFASQTLAITDQRISELTRSIANVRWVDRQRVADALEQIEMNRLGDRAQLAGGLQALAAQTNPPSRRQTN